MKLFFRLSLIFLPACCMNLQSSKFIDKEGSEFNKPWVRNVVGMYNRLPTSVEPSNYLAAWTGNKIPSPRYTQTSKNSWGIIQGGQNHFQSIMRLPYHLGLGQYLVLTGSDPHGRDKDHPKTKGSKLFIIKMESEKDRIYWNGNLTGKGVPFSRDRIVKVITIDKDLWHAGGLDIEGKYLAVPIEKGGVKEDSGDKSKVIIFDISKPENPKQITEIVRNGTRAGVASLIRLSDGHYLLGVWSDSDKKPVRYDFYYSKTTDMKDGFQKKFKSAKADTFENHDIKKHYQNINFVRDYKTGKIYAVGTLNTSSWAPVLNGRDEADLLLIGGSFFNKTTIVNKGKTKHFFCKDDQCNFSAGAGLFVPDTYSLGLYSVPHWLPDDGKTLHFNQYLYVNSLSIVKK